MARHQLHIRLLIFFIALLGISLQAGAQGAWDGTASTKPQGEGTVSHPYKIESGANLKWMYNNIKTVRGKYFKQTADIDMGGHSLYDPETAKSEEPRGIGYPYTYKDTSQPFQGTYDGGGFEIKNLSIPICNVLNSKNITHAYGLFAYVKGGTLRNIVLNNVKVTFPAENLNLVASGSTDMRVGTLVGSLGEGSVVENVIVKNSTITDNGHTQGLNTLFCGGVIGEMQKEYFTAGVTSNITVRNIYADVDISLGNVNRDGLTDDQYSKWMNYCVGGILGRGRTLEKPTMPVNVFYTGTINAPWAFVSPLWGMFRSGTNDKSPNQDFAKNSQAYSGEYGPNPNYKYLNSEADNANRYFYDYKLWVGNEEKEINATYPGNVHDATKVRTINALNIDPKGKYNPRNLEDVRQFQGVNHSNYIDLSTEQGKAELVGMFNDYAAQNSNLRQWVIAGDEMLFLPGISVERSGFNQMKVRLDGVSSAEGYTVRWKYLLSKGTTVTVETATGFDGLSSDHIITDVHPDQIKSVTGVLVRNNVELISATADFTDPMAVVLQSGETTFRGEVMNSPYADATYKFAWLADYGDGNGFVTLDNGNQPPSAGETYDFGGEPLPHRVRLVLCDYDGMPLVHKDNPSAEIHSEVPVSPKGTDWTRYSDYTLTAKMEMVGGNLIPVAYIKDADGNILSGGAGESVVSDPAVSYLWETTDDPTDESNWRDDYPGHLSLFSWGTVNNHDTYHRVTYYLGTVPIATTYASLRRIVFVYDKDATSVNMNYVAGFDNDFYPDGDDNNSGWDPYHAVKTMRQAYRLLYENNSTADNNIVVMGYNAENDYWVNKYNDAEHERNMKKCATIQGSYGKFDFHGTLKTQSIDSNYAISLRCNTVFKNMTFNGAGGKVYFYCNLNDVTFDEGVKMTGYAVLTADTYGIGDSNAPDFTLIGGYHNYDVKFNSADDAFHYPETNSVEGLTTITIKSGCFGRVIAGSRNDGNVNKNTLNVFGHPLYPHRVNVKVDIEHKSGDIHEATPGSSYKYDIGLLAGGQTDGSIFCESEIDMTAGTVGRFIAGNISFGRAAKPCPADGFYGSTTINVTGGQINELIGGTLGRLNYTGTGYVDDAQIYFYGRSIINIGEEGADNSLVTIGKNIYGAGAGGVMGIGTGIDEWHHTDDKLIPYMKSGDDVKVYYGDYEALLENGSIKMPMRDGTLLDLGDSYCEVNVKSGTIKGDIFGGGVGYSKQFKPINASANPPNLIDKASTHAGTLYGRTRVSVSGGVVEGSVYGGAAGDDGFQLQKSATCTKDFTRVACIYGSTRVDISGGVINKDVYAGSLGVDGYPQMAAIYGTTQLNMSGGKIYGDIYGGSSLANMDKLELTREEAMLHGYAVSDNAGDRYFLADSGNTYVNISGGVVGDNIFGGSRGEVADENVEGSKNTKSTINGDTHVTITGGEFLDYPYKQLGLTDADAAALGDAVSHPENYRTFNIYGGGNLNCDIIGNAHLDIKSSLLVNEKSFMPRSQNPNALTEHDKSESFQAAYMDITFRRFCVYGGGYGINTNVLNTEVRVGVVNSDLDVAPHGYTLESPLPHQSFFDIAGGGYNGDVGYWAAADGTPSKSVDISNLKPEEVVANYDHYVGGQCTVRISDNTFARKVIGGGFYGSCRRTDTYVISGSLRQVYGGSLLGYVYDRAYLKLGNRIEDFIAEDASHNFSFKNDPEQGEEWNGQLELVPADVYQSAALEAERRNSNIFITENIYGGNDVKGIIGTRFWTDPEGKHSIDVTDGGPLFCSDVSGTENNGIIFNIYGGTFMGNIYGAGNGHYRGYYVPESVRYNDGPPRMYRDVISSVHHDPTIKAKAYRSRPMVGHVNINVRGNSMTDRVNIHGNFFGGGRECTIGEFNTILPLEDPRRLAHGGLLRVNFGSHVDVTGSVYLGNEGRTGSMQPTVPADVDLSTFNTTATKNLHHLGDVAYSHWFYDKDLNYYRPGYPEPGKVDGNYNMTGLHMLYAFRQNVMMEGDVELTFYNDLYKRNPDGSLVMEKGEKVRKTWVPGEKALDVYDSQDVKMNSFFLGGHSGTMSNNNVMVYCYDDDAVFDPNKDPDSHSDIETKGSIYRITLPAGVTIRDKVVMGSESALVEYYDYTPDGKEIIKTKEENGKTVAIEPMYKFDGGVMTQSIQSFDLMVYNAEKNKDLPEAEKLVVRDLPEDFYTDSSDMGVRIRGLKSYTFPDGTQIWRKQIDYEKVNPVLQQGTRYDLAAADKEGRTGVVGDHLTRESMIGDVLHTVSKLTVNCQFELVDVVPDSPDENYKPGSPEYMYGGVIYGGCYNSGLVMGDVVMNIGSDMLGHRECFKNNDISSIGNWASLKYNIGRVFGGGFGERTTMQGDIYVNLLRNFRGMNVFGGGMEGHVEGTAHVNYIGAEDTSYVFGNIYGGALQGDTGDGDMSAVLRLYSGNVNKVYGGSCMGHMKGRAFIEACDQVAASIDDYLDLKKLLEYMGIQDWRAGRLIAGSIYGGNDIAGTITRKTQQTAPIADDEIEAAFQDFTTGIWMHEEKDTENIDPPRFPGGKNGYNGFPLVGELYGGSNGNYGLPDDKTGTYSEGSSVELATGNGNGFIVKPLDNLALPNIDRTYVRINGGTVINGYGGGDMSDVTERAKITVDYPLEAFDARAGFDSQEELTRVWNVLHFESNDQQAEVTHEELPVFTQQIFRLFGGNNNATMEIQPEWDLNCGFIGSLYSGGNIGEMTYCEPIAGTNKLKGLTLTIDKDMMRVDNVYGGGRIGSINPRVNYWEEKSAEEGNPVTYDTSDFYGATLNISAGVVEHVYGGNDVSGGVAYGTDVSIEGAISGDVYSAGNGNYLYYYDADGDYSDDGNPKIKEAYTTSTIGSISQGARYFVLYPKPEYNNLMETNKSAATIMAINSFRPHVERARLTIKGSEDKKVWVKGSVYCGGNSSTVMGKEIRESDVEFHIGDHVYLNGVFLGSNGQNLALGSAIDAIQDLNDISMLDANTLSTGLEGLDKEVYDHEQYKTVLDLYMRAVEMHSLPRDFELKKEATEAYIGDFCVGGNRGSLIVNQTIKLAFPENLTVYNSIVGGCRNADVNYGGERGVTHVGGIMKGPRFPKEISQIIDLEVKNRFTPVKMDMDFKDSRNPKIKFVSQESKEGLYPDGVCNIYGGCLESGMMEGDINIDFYSDLLHYAAEAGEAGSEQDEEHPEQVDRPVNKQGVITGMKELKPRRNFTVIGAGSGSDTEVWGNVSVNMLAGTDAEGKITHPSAAIIFGAAKEGLLVGNSQVTIRDGKILANVYGASEASRMYGSTAVMVGYPTYYRAKSTGVYMLFRSDYFSETARNNYMRQNGTIAMAKSIALVKGDIVPANVYDMIIGRVHDGVVNGETLLNGQPYKIGMDVPVANYDVMKDDAAKSAYFTKVSEQPENWDDVTIWIGDQDPDNYYGQGNIYGGGYQPGMSGEALAGKLTLLSYRGEMNPANLPEGIFGGNTAVMVWDNPKNADPNFKGEGLRDHISVGTCTYRQIPFTGRAEAMGYYTLENGKYEFQTSGKMVSGKTYYEKIADGGIYGGGRKVFVEGFRSIDLAYYGYAEHSPQEPKLINTLQRASVATITDCCLELVGAADFTLDLVDTELYSINRVDELRMVSSLSDDDDLVCHDAAEESESGAHLVKYTTPRSRNYMGLTHPVHDMASFYSNWTMTRKYHNEKGEKTDVVLADRERRYVFPTEDGSGTNDLTDYINAKYGNQGMLTYTLFKHDKIEDYYKLKDEGATISTEDQQEFSKRNVGTSANMVGIRSKFALRVQGHSVKPGETTESLYYGPAYGLAEIKLLTGNPGEGGGYVYALNRHYDPETDGGRKWEESGSWMSEWGQDFYMVTGNFVYPGAPFGNYQEVGFVVDDCMPEGEGYDAHHATHPDVNDANEQHYWFVRGSIFRYSATLTGITSDEEQNFYIDNDDHHITLANVNPGAKIRLKEVVWLAHDEQEGKSCDLHDEEKDFNLYLSVDHNTRNMRTTSENGAYVAELPRNTVDKEEVLPFETTYGDYTDADGNKQPNTPSLGIRLRDNNPSRKADQPNEVGRKYYEDHMEQPHHLEAVLEVLNPLEDGSGDYSPLLFTYIIELDVKYLLGPKVTGEVTIENCALPGEYIYVNADNIEVDMDESLMGIIKQSWRIYPNDKEGNRLKDADGNYVYMDVEAGKADFADDPFDSYIDKTNEQIMHVPAYYYMDGWEPAYRISISNYETEITVPFSRQNRLEVHNYHRMKPLLKDGSTFDQHFVDGSRIYIEDQEDLKFFLEYLAAHQDANSDADKLPYDKVLHPRYAKGLNFYLSNNITVPKVNGMENPVRFEGAFHGDGYTLTIPQEAQVKVINGGAFYNTGFLSKVNDDEAKVFEAEEGLLQNCFYFNTYGKGSLISSGSASAKTLYNCYQNTKIPVAGISHNQLLTLSNEAFGYGMATYNLNGYYLQKRHIMLHGPSKNDQFATPNNSYALEAKDKELKEELTLDAYNAYAVPYMEEYYNNGDYRFAHYDPYGVGIPTALRTTERPNYFDENNYHGTEVSVTHHSRVKPQDETRWNEEHGVYHPIFEDDYMFFGEDLNAQQDGIKDEYPTHYKTENRVFRVGGFYGTASDKGYFFNRDAYLDSPLITAVDFVGYRDRDMYDALGYLKDSYRADINDDGWIIKEKEYEMYCPPSLDLPWTKIGEETYHDFNSFKINSGVVTHNLLIYTRDNDKASGYLTDYHYGDMITLNNYAQHSDEEIRCHHIVDTNDGPKMHGGYFHLKDNFDFNAPVAFTADTRAWYSRLPFNYAKLYTEEDGKITEVFKTGWEGICLPFTVGKTYAATTDVSTFPMDMGEITHFFGTETKGHEYWLRRFVGVDADNSDRLVFERPTAQNMTTLNEDKICDYPYSNDAISWLYRNEDYNFDFDQLYHFADNPDSESGERERIIKDYRMLSEGVPYIVTYPSEDYYEFDLSGNFYADFLIEHGIGDGERKAVKQSICYLAVANSDGTYTIPETDKLPKVEYSDGSYTMHGTFMHLSEKEVDGKTLYVVNGAGTEFVKEEDRTKIKPFHVYMSRQSSQGKPTRSMSISGDRGTAGDNDGDKEEPGEPEELPDELTENIEVWVNAGVLYVRVPCDMNLYVYNVQGQVVRYVKAYAGENRYSGLEPGIYIVAKTKVII